jgi:triacylglycerol lipase
MRLAKSALAAVAALIMALCPAGAEDSPMPDDMAWKLLELGRVIDPSKTAALYAPLQEKEPYRGVKVERDLKYGAADRNLLDVFGPEAGPSTLPVLIFVHGGGFVAGNKRTGDSPFYDNIMLWAVKNGFVGVNMTYRLAPQSPWPAAAEDLSAAVRWVADNIASRGGEPARIYMMGHSAGASHVATYVSHPEFWGSTDSRLAGAILVSGLYDLADMPPDAGPSAYYGRDTALYAERSSVKGLLQSKTPVMIAAAELDPPGFVDQFNRLKDARCKVAGGCAHAILLPQHSHMSEIYSINTSEDRLTREILEFVASGK